MLTRSRAGLLCVLLLLLALLNLQPGHSLAQTADKQDPLVIVEGYDYRYIPRGKIHMFDCAKPDCAPGTKVSYTYGVRTGKPDFKRFRDAQGKVADYLRSQLPAGAVLKLGKPERKQEDGSTVFTKHRAVMFANGSQSVTTTTYWHGHKLVYQIISTAKDKKTADANSSEFLLALLVTGAVSNSNE